MYVVDYGNNRIQVFARSGRGDIDGSGIVDMVDAVLALQLLTGLNPSGIRPDYASSGADVNGDGKIGIEEVLYIMEKEAD